MKPFPAVDARALSEWQDLKFGVFFHWGIFSKTAGYWKGRRAKDSDHIMLYERIPVREWGALARDFNPTGFDAEAWVRAVRIAGATYVVITTKHHDGLAMFDSPSSDFDIVDRSPFKRDPMKELADACHRHGLRLGFYYSLGRDWADPDCPTENGRRSNTWDYPDEESKVFHRYFERKARPQVVELCTRYGRVDILWFDTPEEISRRESRELRRLIHKYQPRCIINDRIGNGLGDHDTREQTIGGMLRRPWESCNTMSATWCYDLDEKDQYKSTEALVHQLAEIVSKGGNYLLNTGPRADGTLTEEALERFAAIGKWLKVNGEAIYGASASPYDHPFPWGWITQKGSRLFLLIKQWPKDGELRLFGLRTKVRKVYALAGKRRALKFEQFHDKRRAISDLAIALPAKPLDETVAVIVVEGAEAISVGKKRCVAALNAPDVVGAGEPCAGVLSVSSPFARDVDVRIQTTGPAELDVVVADTFRLACGRSSDVPFVICRKRAFSGRRNVTFELCRGDGCLADTAISLVDAAHVLPVCKLRQPLSFRCRLSDWAGINPQVTATRAHVAMGKGVRGAWQGPDDLSFQTRVAWDGKAVCLRLDIKDDVIVVPPRANRTEQYVWAYDCLEVFVAPATPTSQDIGKRYAQMLVVPPGGRKVEACDAILLDETLPVSARFVGRRTPDGYIIEGRIAPRTASNLPLTAGGGLLLEVAVHDNDDPAGAAGMKARMSLFAPRGADANEPRNWGRWRLMER